MNQHQPFLRMSYSIPKRTRAFTLIELLTVIAIIGILAAIIIPTVGRVRTSAKRADVQSNLRQTGSALLLYTQESKGLLPFGYNSSATENPDNNWAYSLASRGFAGPGIPPDSTSKTVTAQTMLGSVFQREISPNDNGSMVTFSANPYTLIRGTGKSRRNLSSIATPSKTFLVSEGAKNGGTSYLIAFLFTAGAGSTPDNLKDNRFSVLFADGHVETRDLNGSNWPQITSTRGQPGYDFWEGRP